MRKEKYLKKMKSYIEATQIITEKGVCCTYYRTLSKMKFERAQRIKNWRKITNLGQSISNVCIFVGS